MASTNQSPFYKKAETNFLLATTPEEKIECLRIMIKECPKHKSSENMLKNLTMRHKKLRQSIEKSKKSGKGKKEGIKKPDMQVLIVGFANTGKSSFFNLLTNQNAKTSPHAFTTFQPQLGTFKFEDTKIQLIDLPPFPNQDKSLINSTDVLLLVIDDLEQLTKAEQYLKSGQLGWEGKRAKRAGQIDNADFNNLDIKTKAKPFLENTNAKIITIFNKTDLLDEKEKRKLEATLKSKKLNFILNSCTHPDKDNLEQLKKQIFETFPIIRIYTKEPHKPTSKEPMILKKQSTIEQAAEKILKGMSKKIKKSRIWGPSSKFAGQIVGPDHILKDKDVLELTI